MCVRIPRVLPWLTEPGSRLWREGRGTDKKPRTKQNKRSLALKRGPPSRTRRGGRMGSVRQSGAGVFVGERIDRESQGTSAIQKRHPTSDRPIFVCHNARHSHIHIYTRGGWGNQPSSDAQSMVGIGNEQSTAAQQFGRGN